MRRMKFVLYTMVGSVLMLVAIIALYFMHGDATGTFTFSYPQIQSALASGRMVLAPAIEQWLFVAFFLAFADQSSAVSLPHLASGRARRSPDGRIGPAGRSAC